MCAGDGEGGGGDNRPTRAKVSLGLWCRTLRNISQQSMWVKCRDPARPANTLPTAFLPIACHVAKNVLGILEVSGIPPKKFEPQTLEISQETKVSVGHRMSMPLGSRYRVSASSPLGLGVHCGHSSRTLFWQD